MASRTAPAISSFPMHHADTVIRAHPVAEFGRPIDAPKSHVRTLAGRNRSNVVRRPQRARRMPRDAAQCLLRVNPNRVHAMVRASKIDVQGEVPGLESVATAISTPASRSSATGGGVVCRNVK